MGVPQIIQVIKPFYFVLKSMVTWNPPSTSETSMYMKDFNLFIYMFAW